MKPNYHVAGEEYFDRKRVLLQWSWFDPYQASRECIRSAFKKLGYIELNVSVIDEARKLVGTGIFDRARPKKACAPEVLNCSTFMYYLHSLMGVSITCPAYDQRDQGRRLDKPVLGSMVFTTGVPGKEYHDGNHGDRVGHVGIVVGLNPVKVIHAYALNAEQEVYYPAIHEVSLKGFLSKREFRGFSMILPPLDDCLVLELPDACDFNWSKEAFRQIGIGVYQIKSSEKKKTNRV